MRPHSAAMKTIELAAFGAPGVLNVVEAKEPHAGPGQVRVRVRAIGVNPYDAKVRAGLMESSFSTKLPTVLGAEIAGIVDEVGEGVAYLAVGDEVFGWSDSGAYAELAIGTELARKPASLSWPIAASLPVAGETATRVLDLLELDRGETLLVHGGSGAVGSMAVQLAVLRGAKVIATGSGSSQDYLASLGATPVVYGKGLVTRIRETRMLPIDAVFDVSGKGALADSVELRGGKTRIVTIADPAAFNLGIPFSSEAKRSVALLEHLGALASSGQLQISVAATLSLERAADAHVLIEDGHTRGKVVLTVD